MVCLLKERGRLIVAELVSVERVKKGERRKERDREEEREIGLERHI